MEPQLRNPWLIAVWPGMGGVAQIAGAYLVRTLRAQQIAELDAGAFVETQSIVVREGLVQPVEAPRDVFYGWRNPDGDRDLVILLGSRQPSHDGYRYCQTLLDQAARLHVERVFTFAAMATPILPGATPRVLAVCTKSELLPELKRDNVVLLKEGEISGLNGVFVAAAAARDLPGFCLLGEFPFFAAAVPNPKASAAVLRVFANIAGIRFDLGELDAEAKRIERNLTQHLENMQRAQQSAESGESEEPEFPLPEAEEPAPDSEAGAGEPAPKAPRERPIAPEVRERIEQLFAQSKNDRSKAFELKHELDRHGLFKRYEDRFLDLFKTGG